MLNSKALGEKIAAELDKVAAVNALCEKESRDATEAEQSIVNEAIGVDGKGGNVAKLRAQLAQAQAFEAELANQASLRVGNRAPAIGFHGGGSDADSRGYFGSIRVPASCRARQPLKAFHGPEAEQEAFAFGRMLQAIAGSGKANSWCQDNLGFNPQAAMSEGSDSEGGFLVPPTYEAAIIRLVAKYGIARRKCRIKPMSSDTDDQPRRTGGLIAYAAGEIQAATASTMAGDSVKLVAKDFVALTYWSRNLEEDAAIAIADLNATEMGLAFAKKEDECLFLGDAASTYNGIVGLKNALNAGSVVTAASTHTTLATLTMADFYSMQGALATYADDSAEWYVHKSVWAQAMQRLGQAQSGVTSTEIVNGMSRDLFLGRPVNFVTSMTSTATTSTAGVVYYGDLMMSATFGDRRGLNVATSREVAFVTRQIAMLATERYDINIHDKGDSSNAGGIVRLDMAAS